MLFVRIIPAVLSSILISAHFLRGGYSVIAVLCLLSPTVLLFNRKWALYVIQTLLVLFAVEWLRTLFNLIQLRMEYGIPWIRLAVILTGVALFSLASSGWLRGLIAKK